MDRKDAWWWPEQEEMEGVYWPEGLPNEETLECFIAAFGTQGYVPCDTTAPEPGFEKVALYIDDQGRPTHAAKQTEHGAWSSKLGDWEDIEHRTLAAIEGQSSDKPAFGKAIQFLKRPIA